MPQPKSLNTAPTQHPDQKPAQQPYGIDDWWPNRLDLRVLKENAPSGDPMDDGFDYAAEFSKLDYAAVKDIEQTLKDSKEWWPADWGHYGGLMNSSGLAQRGNLS